MIERPGGSPGKQPKMLYTIDMETAQAIGEMQEKVRTLAREKNAIILAHNYQLPEIQDVADFVGDSLGLSREAAHVKEETIVFCGVHFMAETAKILSPDKTVLIPDMQAGCSLADSIGVDELRAWKARYPGAVVVSYVNTSAAVKAESDWCCTSGNVRQVIEAVPQDKEILFLPDLFLGLWAEKVTGRRLHLWMGECHVHAGITPSDVARWRVEDPTAELLIHPECGCASQAMAFADEKAHILSTEGMITFSEQSKEKRFRIATEVGMLYRLRKEAPGKTFEPVQEGAVCQFMKMIALEKLYDSLTKWQYPVTVDPEIAAKARLAIERMVSIG